MKPTYQRILNNSQFAPPKHWHRIQTIDLHTEGEPLRVITGGFPPLQGNSVLAYRRYIKEHHDDLRRVLMHEPRGHADMYGCLLTPPNDEGADFGILFLHNEGYSTMCGHAIIAITTLAVQMGWVEAVEPLTEVTIDAPCGRIRAFARLHQGKVESVYFHGVPSFVVELDATVEVPGLGKVNYDLTYGGAFYAYVQAAPLGLPLIPENYRQLIATGMDIKHAVMEQNASIQHPFEPDLSFLYGTIFIDETNTPRVDSRNVCIFAEGEVDRCPTGSGVSGRMPIHFARQEINLGETMTIESIIGSTFQGSVLSVEQYGPFQAVIPQVEGSAFITGQHEFLIDPDDPLRHGFFLR